MLRELPPAGLNTDRLDDRGDPEAFVRENRRLAGAVNDPIVTDTVSNLIPHPNLLDRNGPETLVNV